MSAAKLYDFACPECPFTSTGWPTKGLAEKRGQQHLDEHAEGAAALAEGREVDRTKISQSLDDFRAANGVNPDGSLA